MFKWIAVPLGYLMNWCYLFADSVLKLPLAYVFAMFFFAIITKVLQFPLAINQQKSSAKMAAIQPLLLDVQKKFAKDKQRQQVETQKLQEEMGYNPMSGCLPMVIQFVLMFGFVEVIYAPLTYMLRIPAEFISKFGAIVTRLTSVGAGDRLFETRIIEYVQTNDSLAGLFSGVGFSDSVSQIQNLGMSIGTINLWEKPVISEPSLLWLMPLFSIVTMLLSTFIMNKTNAVAASGAQGTGKMMTYAMVGVSAIFSFMWPAAFSLYWGFQSLISILQTLLLRKIVNSDKIKEETLKAYEERKKAVKGTKKVQITDKRTGKVTEKELSGRDLVKQRLQKARELDAEKYADEEIADSLSFEEYEGKKTEQKTESAKNKKKAGGKDADKEEENKLKNFDEMFGKKENGKKKKKK